jgi:hypothetical protein
MELERFEDFDEGLVQCAECLAECSPGDWERVNGRPLCHEHAREEEECERVPQSIRRRYREAS